MSELLPLTPQEWTALVHLRREHQAGIKKRRGWTFAAMQQEYELFRSLANRRRAMRSDEWAEDKRILEDFYWLVEDERQKILRVLKNECPIGFFIPSYEQAQQLNSWHPEFDPNAPLGYFTTLNFGTVRGGKTLGACINNLLWTIPNDPNWMMFEEREDPYGRGKYRVLPRFKWDEWKRSGRKFYDKDEPPKATCEIWHGCVDEAHWLTKLEKMYREWLPDKLIARKGKDREWYRAEKWFRLKHGSTITAKLYNSEMQSWGGHELFCIALDEGPPRDKLEEVVFRTKYLQWTFTPREAANVGEKSLLAKQAFEGKVKLPGHPDIGPFILLPKMENIPTQIMAAEDKRKRIAQAESMGDRGKAAMGYGFFNSSPNVFNNFDRKKHVLPFDGAEAKRRWPDAVKIRGFDEGMAHITACVWVMILRTGEYVIYRDFGQAGLSVSERCERIISQSRNERVVTHNHWDKDFVRYKEQMSGEIIRTTFADSKIFRRNPETVQDDWVDSYRKKGLVLTRATYLPPERRCDEVNDMFLPDHTRKHLVNDGDVGHKLYITNDCVDVIERLENYLQEQFKSGPNKGQFTGKPEKTGDDLVDAMCYACASKMKWIDMAEVQARRTGGFQQSFVQQGNEVTGY